MPASPPVQPSPDGRQTRLESNAHTPFSQDPEQHSLSSTHAPPTTTQIGPPHSPPWHASEQQPRAWPHGEPSGAQYARHLRVLSSGSHRPLQHVLRALQELAGAVQVPDGRHVADSHRLEQHAAAPVHAAPLAAQGVGPHSLTASVLAASDLAAASAAASLDASALAPAPASAPASATLASWLESPTWGARSTDSTPQATMPQRMKIVEKAVERI
jgi:hypothetical protein